MGIHLLYCAHGGERTASHDVIQNIFSSIAKDAWFHILQKQTHILPSPSPQSFHKQVNIVLSIKGIRTLVGIIITNPIQRNLVSWDAFSHGLT
jgi:hypothetical protein